jgi:DNA-binding PadR family transcriptional regulator
VAPSQEAAARRDDAAATLAASPRLMAGHAGALAGGRTAARLASPALDILPGMARRATERAVAEAAPLEAATEAAGTRTRAGGSGSADPLVAELRRAGLLPLLVLHLLADGPSYGNQLMERIGALTGGLVAVNPNTMYPLLRSLEERGLIAGEWEHPERRSRRFYRITPAGSRERAGLTTEIAPRLDALARAIASLRTELSA